MGMNNEDIEKMIASVESGETDLNEKSKGTEEGATSDTSEVENETNSDASALTISQDEMDSLLSTFVSDDDGGHESLIEEIHSAILDSAQLTLLQWVNLRKKLREIEELIPHIDLLIRLKSKKEKENPELFD